MEKGLSKLEEGLQSPGELLDSLVPQVEELDKLLEMPREVVERILYEREGYWSKIVSSRERTAMIDYIREITFALAWEVYNDVDVAELPDEMRKPISLQVLLEYCLGIFKLVSRLVLLIERSPNQKLVRERVFVDFGSSRKPGPGTIHRLLSHPNSHRFERTAPNSTVAPNLQRLLSQRPDAGDGEGHLPAQVSETHAYVDFNTQENRFVRRFLTAMHKDVNTIGNMSEAQGEESVRVEAVGLMRGISELLEYDFLKYSSPSGAVRHTSALHRQPYYHQIYEIYRHYQRIFNFDWGYPLFKLPLRRTWLLYEYWTFFKVIELLKNQDFELVRDRITLFFEDEESNVTLEIPKGQPTVLELKRSSDDTVITLLYSGETPDQTFLNPAEAVYHPIAPSIFMMCEGKAFVFEVKFKQYTANGSWHDDLDRLHGYRDALGKEGSLVQEA